MHMRISVVSVEYIDDDKHKEGFEFVGVADEIIIYNAELAYTVKQRTDVFDRLHHMADVSLLHKSVTCVCVCGEYILL